MSDNLGTLTHNRALMARAIASDDVGAVRRYVTDGAMFASLTIRCQTRLAEAAYVAWKDNGRPLDVSTLAVSGARFLPKDRLTRATSVAALSNDELMTIATAEPRRAEEIFADLTTGYGPPKSSFALACAGLGTQACLDSHLLLRHVDAVRPYVTFQKDKPHGWKVTKGSAFPSYWRAVSAIYGATADTASAQWQEWLTSVVEWTTHDVLRHREV